ILYDFEQLKHKSTRFHFEKPERLSSIISYLKEQNLLNSPNIEVIDKLTPASKEIIRYVHDENYIKFIEQMYPKDSKKKQVLYEDTYANEYTKQIAEIGVGAMVQALDNIQSGKWKNAFCIIRPPGHHSGEKNTCCGFAFLIMQPLVLNIYKKYMNLRKYLLLIGIFTMEMELNLYLIKILLYYLYLFIDMITALFIQILVMQKILEKVQEKVLALIFLGTLKKDKIIILQVLMNIFMFSKELLCPLFKNSNLSLLLFLQVLILLKVILQVDVNQHMKDMRYIIKIYEYLNIFINKKIFDKKSNGDQQWKITCLS
ncbi:hypothetical protein IMG5_052780, partial [Ichthyophthirius multifiliis]